MDITEYKCEVCKHKEKGIAMKPKILLIDKDDITWQCRTCLEQYVTLRKYNYNYCPNCGQHIDWGEDYEG